MPEQSNPAQEPALPTGYTAVAPWLISADTEAEIAFLADVFGASERPGSRVMNGTAINHVEVDLLGAAVLLFDAPAQWRTPGALRVYVPDIDRVVQAATARGAELVTEPTEMAFGDRIARLRDPQGHLWWVHEHVEDVSTADMMERFGEPRFAAANDYVARSLGEHMAAYAARDPLQEGSGEAP